MADEDGSFQLEFEQVTRPRTVRDSRYFLSPFVEISNTAYRILLQKYGTHGVYLPVIHSSCIDQERLKLLQLDQFENCIVQFIIDDGEFLVKAAGLIQECCCNLSAIDITVAQDRNLNSTDELFKELISSIKTLCHKVSLPIACKLMINLEEIDDTVKKAGQLHYAGCKVLLLHGRIHGFHKPSVLKRENWDIIKKIRNSVSQETAMILEIGCSSVNVVEECLGFTGVEGIAMAEPLSWNPAFFLENRLSTLLIIRDYIGLCKKYSTHLDTAKETLLKFSGYLFRRFSGTKTRLVSVTSYVEMDEVVLHLNEEYEKLSKKQAKSIERLQQKKERYRMNKLRRKGEILTRVANNTTDDQLPDDRLTKKQVKQARNEKMKSALVSGQRVAVDLSLEEHMTDKEITKVAGQIRRLYGSNLKSSQPFHLYLTGMNSNSRIYRECIRQNEGFDKYMIDMSENKVSEIFDAEAIVYLSPDSPNILGELDSNKVYVIGGLVDHQVIKGVSLNKAGSSKFSTARLPIDKYMEKKTCGNHSYSRVLTINQVFDIVLKFYETKDWMQALHINVPKRKGFIPKNAETPIQSLENSTKVER